MHCFKSLFHKSKEAKIQRLRKNIFTKLSSFFSCFCKIIHSFIFLIFDKTCNGAKHQTCERFPNWEAWTSLKRGANVSHDHLKIWLVYYLVKESVMINIL